MDEPSSPERLAIVVVVRDRFSMFQRCLAALYAHTDVPFRLLVVAGGVDQETKDYLHRLEAQKGNIKLVFAHHLLLQGEARNIGMRQVDESLCVVLENDTIVHPGWLPPLVQCMREERAAVVMPLVLWYRGIHAVGCTFEQQEKDGTLILRHRILYGDIRRKRIDYPESHCILIDRKQLPSLDLFDDVEPSDVDFGLTLRRYGVSIFIEPRSVVTYSAPPPWEVRDIASFKLRWDPAAWEHRNRQFMEKWAVTYDPSEKRASYRRQQLKLGLARWYPSKVTVGMSNLAVGSLRRLLCLVMRGRAWGNPPPSAEALAKIA